MGVVIPVKLQAFEGPLDLLLHLIDKNKINIYDIPIVMITEQYLEYIREMQRQDLEIMSEFLVMAATLIDIKAKMLLPKEVNEEGKEEDPRQQLIDQLIQYKLYRFMAQELKDKATDADRILFRSAELPDEIKEYKAPVDPKKLLEGITLDQLNALFGDILKRQKERQDPVRSTFGEIEKEEISMEEKMETVEQYIYDRGSCTFRELILTGRSRMQMVVTFLVILELMKSGSILVFQEEIFGEIYISKNE